MSAPPPWRRAAALESPAIPQPAVDRHSLRGERRRHVFAIIFGKTRQCWPAGLKGGAIFGFWIGLIAFFSFFYDPLVLEGYPYYLAWCQGGIAVISAVIGGAVVGAIVKS